MSDTEFPDELRDGKWVTTTEEGTERLKGSVQHLYDWTPNVVEENTPADEDPERGIADETFDAICARKNAPHSIVPNPETFELVDVWDLLLQSRSQRICKSCWKKSKAGTYVAQLDLDTIRQHLRDHLDEDGNLSVDSASDGTLDAPESSDGHTTVPIRLAAALEIDVPDTLQSDLARILEALGGNVSYVSADEPQEVDATMHDPEADE